MAMRSSREATNALLTAGIVMAAVGGVLATFPNGLFLGLVVAVVGVALFTVFGIRAWHSWRRRPPRPAREHPDPDRFWNAETRLQSLMGVSIGFTVGTTVLAIVNPTQNDWSRLWIFGPLLIVSTVAFVIVRRRNRAKPASITEAPATADHGDAQNDPADPQRE